MTTEEEKEILKIICEARKKARGYADFFGWGADRDIEEWGVVTSLAESLKADGITLFTSLARRGRPNDPPDCEALDSDGKRVAIEVTELVDGKAIQAYKAGRIYEWADWDQDKFTSSLEALISRKDSRFDELKGTPYEGGYFIVIFTDEPMLNRIAIESFLRECKIKKPENITRAFLLVSYDPSIKKCPYYELQFHG